jgi:hypothetical protein
MPEKQREITWKKQGKAVLKNDTLASILLSATEWAHRKKERE